jgi:two-component system chemotaxis response regulator CheB
MAGYIVVIGASAGGLNTVVQLVKGFKKDLDAAYIIVLHLFETKIGEYLVAKIQDRTPLSCLLVQDNMEVLPGHVYVAVPNYHVLVNKGMLTLSAGAKENRWRPSIDVLFRTAAASYSNRVIGIVLTGMLNDGTTGSSAIKRSGGIVIAQDPNEADYPDMPNSVIENVEVDHVLTVSQMPGVIQEIITKADPKERTMPPEDIKGEAVIEDQIITSISEASKYGESTPFTCPDCGGVLFLHDQDYILRLKCHTGHSFSVRDLFVKQAEEFENSLWYAIRSLEQKKHLYESLVTKYKSSNVPIMAEDYRKNAEEIEEHIKTLKELLLKHQQLRSKEE